MTKSLLLATLIATAALAACGKKEEAPVAPAPVVEAPAAASEAAPAPVMPASEAASDAMAPASAASN